MRWIVVSVVMSVVLTALLNIGLRAFPDAGRHVARGLDELTSPDYDCARERDRRLQVFGSVVLTIVVNLALRV